jgi:hypothetical protein
MTDPETQKTIDTYLAALRKQLRELMEEDATDIVDEIRAHILDKTSNGGSPEKVSATLAALGTPEELASRYRTEEWLRRAQLTRSPLVSLRSLLHWATLSFTGIVVFLVSVFGYALGGALVVFAMLKAAFPRATGLWKTVSPDGTWGLNLSFSSGTPPPGQELLGWWVLPIGLLLGTGLLLLTFRFGTWSIRKFWRPRAGQQPDGQTSLSSVGGV